MEHFEKFQALAVITYLIDMEGGMGKIESSEHAAGSVYITELYEKKKVEGSYKSRLIRIWADLFLKTGKYHIFANIIIIYIHDFIKYMNISFTLTFIITGELPVYRQGKHIKTSSIITDEHVQVKLRYICMYMYVCIHLYIYLCVYHQHHHENRHFDPHYFYIYEY